MTAFNVVRFRVKSGAEQRFVDAHRAMNPQFQGFLRGNLVKTGDQTFCMIGEWLDMASLAAARPGMIGLLDTFRELLEDLGAELGVTDPVSGESVVELALPKPAPKAVARKKAAPRKTAKKKAGKKVTKKAGKAAKRKGASRAAARAPKKKARRRK